MTAFDHNETVISQYDASPRLRAMIDTFNEVVDPTVNLDAFYNLMWNVDTAKGYGLDVWGRIVGVTRVLEVTSDTFFGFNLDPDPQDYLPFGEAPFFVLGATGNYYLTDAAFRLLIMTKAMANITDGSSRFLNQMMLLLFRGNGNAYVHDNLNMSITYTFTFQPTAVQMAIIEQSGVLPRPVGVAADVSII